MMNRRQLLLGLAAALPLPFLSRLAELEPVPEVEPDPLDLAGVPVEVRLLDSNGCCLARANTMNMVHDEIHFDLVDSGTVAAVEFWRLDTNSFVLRAGAGGPASGADIEFNTPFIGVSDSVLLSAFGGLQI